MGRRTSHLDKPKSTEDEVRLGLSPRASKGSGPLRCILIPGLLVIVLCGTLAAALMAPTIMAPTGSGSPSTHTAPFALTTQPSAVPHAPGTTTTPSTAPSTAATSIPTTASTDVTVRPPHDHQPRQFAVSSSDELRRVCHEQAPQLENATWYHTFQKTGQDVLITNPLKQSHTYLFMPYPMCLHLDTGRMFAEHADQRINRLPRHRKEVPHYLKQQDFYDLEDLFVYMKKSQSPADSSVQLIPALAMMPFGPYMATHMWHFIYDVLGAFTFTTLTVAKDIWDVPRQGVLSDEKGARWIDRGGDLPLKQALSAMILNGFSTFTANTSSTDPSAPPVPAFVKHTPIAYSEGRPPEVLNGAFKDLVPRTLCFCQNLFIPSYGEAGVPPPRPALSIIQDRTALSFGAPPYKNLTEESVWDIERQRIERYPAWARQFWPTTPGTAAYQPRVLFIHRAKRTIANVAAYVKAMRDMGFRVEEVYPERLPTAQQYYLGRYADVVVGMHGLGIGHALWMNRLPTGCRTVIEFRLWAGKGVPLGLEDVLMRRAQFHYVTPEPIDVVFGPSVAKPMVARDRIKAMGHRGYTHPGWDDQEAVFNEMEVMKLFMDVKQHVLECLAPVENPTLLATL